MELAPDAPLVLVVNTSEEVLQLLEWTLEDAGFRTKAAYVVDLKEDEGAPAALLQQHDARVVVWDVAIPYAENYRFFQTVANSPAAAGRRFVLTTTNKRALEELVGPAEVYEIIGKPFDLDAIVEAVRRAFANEE